MKSPIGWAVCIVGLLLPATRAATDRPVVEWQTEHYSIHAEQLDIQEVGRMLEAFYGQMSVAFGKSPEGKLRVEIYDSEKSFHAALKADGQEQVDAGGYYAPGTRKAYLWVQPSEYFTRQLILHEATHQFHFLTATRNRAPRAQWYIEGLAEYYGMHVWDGKTLKLGAVPAISLEDYPAKALDHFTHKLDRNLDGLISGKLIAERPEAWALVHFLANQEADRFAQLRLKLDHGAEIDAAWSEVFGPVTPTLAERFEAWIAGHAQPWKIIWTGWQQVGDELEGKSDTSAMALLKQTPMSLQAELRPVGSAMPGLIFGFTSSNDFYTWQFTGGRTLHMNHFEAGKWTGLRKFALAKGDGPVTLEVQSNSAGASLRAEGKEWATMRCNGSVGLYVQEGTARFKVSVDGK